MNKSPITSGGYIRTLTILTFALMAGQVVFAGIVLFNNSMDNSAKVDFPIAVAYGICGMLLASGLGAGKVIHDKKMKEIRMKTSLEIQLNDYRSAFIIRYAMMEMPGFAAIVFFLLTGEHFLLFFSFASVIAMFVFRPTLNKLIQDLQPDFKTQQLLEDPQAVLFETTRTL